MKIEVKVKPGSKKEEIVREDNSFIVYTHARAHDNEANEAVVRMLAKYFRTAKSNVKIVGGKNYKNKIVEIK